MLISNLSCFPLHVRDCLSDKPIKNQFLNIKNQEDVWEHTSINQFNTEVQWGGLALRKLGIKKKNLIGLMSPSSPQWVMMDQAIMSVGAATVPFFVNVSQFNLKYQVYETKLTTIFISSEEALRNLEPVLSKLKLVIYHNINKKKIPKIAKTKFISYEEFLKIGEKEAKQNKNIEQYEKTLSSISPDDYATIVYTSGTTGEPKGVLLTHKNLIHQMLGTRKKFPLNPLEDSAVTCLPFAHIFERIVIYLHITSGISVYFSPILTKVAEIVRETKPTILVVVPRILEKVFEKMSYSYHSMTGVKKILVKSAVDRAKTKEPHTKQTFIDRLYSKLVYKKFREALGGNLRLVVSGGAALHPLVFRFFRNSGIYLCEGYGLTETSPVIAANDFCHNLSYSVGTLLSGVEVEIQSDGEIWTKSDSVMAGYYKKEKETKEVLTKDGWFKTGDLGKFEDGVLSIEGRKKDLFKLQNGKYVVPLPIEQEFEQSPLVETAMVVGDGKKYAGVLLFMNMELQASHEIEASIKELVVKINQGLQSWEKVVKFKLIWQQLTIEAGDITPKMNIRRNVLDKKFKSEIEELF